MTDIQKKTTLSNFDIDKISKALRMNVWCGMRNEFNPQVLQQYEYFIINVQPSDMSGQHWTALWKHKLNNGKYTCIFFDPFGASPMNEITQACLNLKYRLLYNHTDYQAFESNCCGWFCLSFLVSMRNKETFNTFTKRFNSGENKEINDKIAKKFVMMEWQRQLTKK